MYYMLKTMLQGKMRQTFGEMADNKYGQVVIPQNNP